MIVEHYLAKVQNNFKSGRATEHSYRGDFAELIRKIVPNVQVTNEPSNVTDCGNPDYVITRKDIPVGFIEVKDVGKDLNGKQYKEQFERYRKALDNLIITDYIWFQFYENGQKTHEIRIAEIKDKSVIPIPKNFEKFVNLINNFCSFVTQTIQSPKTLAQMMAAKARLLENILEKAVTSDEEKLENTALKQQYETFKEILIHDLTPKGFSDIYAQTLAYGMFAARLHDKSLDTFSRQEAAELIPKSNPFLRKLFSHVAGVDIDERIVTTVDNLAEVFRATNVKSLLRNFRRKRQAHDAIIHFYETFLSEYDPKLRRARGVWYTPQPVVNFIVRGVDEILKTKFSLRDGLADTSKTTVDVELQGTAVTKGKGKGKRITEKKQVHKVQILDPATGTGTFLAEAINFIYGEKFQSMQGAWSGYVEQHLIPRLNGFELLMASYSMAHLKLDMLLTETGYQSDNSPRFNIYLTNSLEEHHPDTGTLFSSWLSTEANEANNVKRDTPVMVILGNPPYSGESSNKGRWITNLMEDYKKEPGGSAKLKEKNSKWINDDYVKFLRFSQHFIERNGEGIVAFVNPHGFLDNPTFRGMRWNLLNTYDEIYTIDLHGNNKKREVCPDGSVDQNVFDIEQGVSINFFIKKAENKPSELAKVFHYDLYGTRDYKYSYLMNTEFSSVPYQELPNVEPMYYMVPKDLELQEEYNNGFRLNEIFRVNGTGIVSKRDGLCIQRTEDRCFEAVTDILELEKTEFYNKYDLPKDVRDWRYEWAREDISSSGPSRKLIKKICYRPFDFRFIYYTGKSRGFVGWPVPRIMEHMNAGPNYGLSFNRNIEEKREFSDVFIFDELVQHHSLSIKEVNSFAPLFLYPNDGSERISNLDQNIISEFEDILDIPFSSEILGGERSHFSSVNVLDYIYAVLHSPRYREKFFDLLSIDFPRVPYPCKANFWQLTEIGQKLRELHVLSSKSLETLITTYPIDGSNCISRKFTKNSPGFEETNEEEGRVWINDTQYFDRVPKAAWELSIGSYRPAEKWLKDRCGMVLDFDEILSYQKIIASLSETVLLMREVDDVMLF